MMEHFVTIFPIAALLCFMHPSLRISSAMNGKFRETSFWTITMNPPRHSCDSNLITDFTGTILLVPLGAQSLQQQLFQIFGGRTRKNCTSSAAHSSPEVIHFSSLPIKIPRPSKSASPPKSHLFFATDSRRSAFGRAYISES